MKSNGFSFCVCRLQFIYRMSSLLSLSIDFHSINGDFNCENVIAVRLIYPLGKLLCEYAAVFFISGKVHARLRFIIKAMDEAQCTERENLPLFVDDAITVSKLTWSDIGGMATLGAWLPSNSNGWQKPRNQEIMFHNFKNVHLMFQLNFEKL